MMGIQSACLHAMVQWTSMAGGYYKLVCCSCGKLLEDECWWVEDRGPFARPMVEVDAGEPSPDIAALTSEQATRIAKLLRQYARGLSHQLHGELRKECFDLADAVVLTAVEGVGDG